MNGETAFLVEGIQTAPRTSDVSSIDNGGMDSPPLSSDPRSELAALRRRAYGPNADIENDATALARLNALEDAVRSEEESAAHRERAIRAAEWNATRDEPTIRTSRPSASLLDAQPPVTADAASSPRDHASPSPVPVGPVPPSTPPGGATSDPRSATSKPSQWWKRLNDVRPRWLLLGAAVIGIAIGLLLPMLTPPFPDATLSKVGELGAPMPVEEDMGTMYSSDEDTGQLYEQFEGMDVWSVQTDTGAACVYVIADGSWVTAGCAPDGLTVIADAQAYPGAPRFLDTLPEGSVVRFEMRGDVIDVWVVEADEPA